MLALRSVICNFLQLLMLNVSLKQAVWDEVDRQSVKPLVFRTLQGVTTNAINFSITKSLPLTYVLMVVNLSPVATLILAYIILKERISRFEIMMICLTVSGVLLVVFYRDQSSPSRSSTL